MKPQRIRLPDGKVSWLVLDDDYQPIEPITRYIKYIESLERSPNIATATKVRTLSLEIHHSSESDAQSLQQRPASQSHRSD